MKAPQNTVTTRSKAPDVSESLTRRLRGMERQIGTLARAGGGLGSAELDNLARDFGELANRARALEEGKRPRENEGVLQACQHLYNAEGAFHHVFSALRARLHEVETDPDGAILAALRVGQGFTAQVEALLTGARPS